MMPGYVITSIKSFYANKHITEVICMSEEKSKHIEEELYNIFIKYIKKSMTL